MPYTEKPIEIKLVGYAGDTLIMPVLHCSLQREDRSFQDLIEYYRASEAYNFFSRNIRLFDDFKTGVYNCELYFDTFLTDTAVYSIDLIKGISIYENLDEEFEHYLFVNSDTGFVEIDEMRMKSKSMYCSTRWDCYSEYVFLNDLIGKSTLEFDSDWSFGDF
jgi:hypothetical protein